MPGSIQEFISTFTSVDIARPNRFDVHISVPAALINQFNGISQQLMFRCESAELPSRTFETAQQKFGSNPLEKHATQSSYNDCQLTFVVSGDMSEKVFFDSWMEYINPTGSFDFAYKSNYVSDIAISQYDQANKVQYSTYLIDAFPIAVNQLDLNWTEDSYHKLTVVFAYTYWLNDDSRTQFYTNNVFAQDQFSKTTFSDQLGSTINKTAAK
jgi:hypothetical protein